MPCSCCMWRTWHPSLHRNRSTPSRLSQLDTRHCPSLPPVFMSLTPIDPVTHMMEALMPSIKSIIVAHVATLAQTGVLEHVPHHNNADASIAQTSALEHGTQTKPVTLHPITLPFHPLSRRRKKSGIQPKHQNRAKSLKLGKGSIVSPHFPPTQWTPLDNPFMGSLQPQTSRSRHTTAMSMRSDGPP